MGYGIVDSPKDVTMEASDEGTKERGHYRIYHGLLSDHATCNLLAMNKIKGGTAMKKLIITMLFLCTDNRGCNRRR
jgi:hypothetical protein